MFRFASLFGLACLTLAAVALVSTPRKPAAEPLPQPEQGANPGDRGLTLPRQPVSLYFAQFSLN
jgi:hypothetical protein